MRWPFDGFVPVDQVTPEFASPRTALRDLQTKLEELATTAMAWQEQLNSHQRSLVRELAEKDQVIASQRRLLADQAGLLSKKDREILGLRVTVRELTKFIQEEGVKP